MSKKFLGEKFVKIELFFFFFFKIYFYGQINDFEDSVTLEERLLRLEKFVQILNAHDARSAHFIF